MTQPTLAGGRSREAEAPPQSPPSQFEPARRSRGSKRSRDRLAIVVFLAPALVLFCLLVLAPIALASYTSLFKWNGFGGLPKDFIGLDNFVRLFKDENFHKDLWHGALLVILSVAIQLPAALGLALLLNQRIRGRAFYRLLFFAPYVLSEVIAAVLFKLVFSPSRGLVNTLLNGVGLGDLGQEWLANPRTVMISLFLVISWKYFGFHMILYLAGRQNIPRELTESAATEGASTWQTFWHVTLPLLGPTIRISVFLSVIGAIQLFDLVWILTEGGPDHASETLAVTMYNHGFRRFEVGYANAISMTMFLISFVFALFYQRFILRRDIEGAITVMREKR